METSNLTNIDPRLIFAAERTLLAWIRTGLAMMGFGFVVARFSLLLKQLISVSQATFPETPGASLWIGTALVALGAIVNVAASLKYAKDIRSIRLGQDLQRSAWTMGRVTSIVLAVIGLGMVGYLIRLGF